MKLLPALCLITLSSLFGFNSDYGYLSNNVLVCSTDGDYAKSVLFLDENNPYPVELWTKRYEGLSIFDVARQIKELESQQDDILANMPESKKAVIGQRLAQMVDVADRALLMEADKWKAEYVDALNMHIIGLRVAGISSKIPTLLKAEYCKDSILYLDQIIVPCDETGQMWGPLMLDIADKEKPYLGEEVAQYMESFGGNFGRLISWWSAQTFGQGGSYSTDSNAVKVFYMLQRTLSPDGYYWRGSLEDNLENYRKIWGENSLFDIYAYKYQEDEMTVSFTIWHAYVQEVLQNTHFMHNHENEGWTCLVRTDFKNVFERAGIKEFGNDLTLKRAVYDSHSIYKIFINKFSPQTSAPIITQKTPYHRIIHFYPLLTDPKQRVETLLFPGWDNFIKNEQVFHAFNENEFIVISGPDLKFDYHYDVNNAEAINEKLKHPEGVCGN